MRCTKTLAFGLILAAVLTTVPHRSTALAAAPDIAASQYITQEVSIRSRPPNEPMADPRGIKSWLVKQAVELLAGAIRHGSRLAELLIAKLDDKAAKAFREHSGDIARGLEDIAEIPDLTVGIVREKLRYFLTKEIKMSHGTAGVIVEGVTYALGLLL